MNEKKEVYDFPQAKEEWRAFAETEPSVTLYQQPWYWDATCDSPNDWKVILVKEKGVIEAAFPFVYVRRKCMWMIEAPWQVPSSGIWMRKRREEFRSIESDLMYLMKIVNSVVDQLPYFDRFSVGFDSRLWSWQPFHWRGFGAIPHCTMILPVVSPEILIANFSSDRRRRIKKAKSSYQMETDVFSGEDYWAYFEETYRDRGKNISYSKDKFLKVFDALDTHEAMQVRTCRLNGEVVAENIVLFDHNRVYNHFGAQMKKENRDAYAYTLYDAMCYSMEQGKIFDFEGSMIPGVATFNVSFNPEYETLYIITKESARYRAVNGARKTVRAFWEWLKGEK